MESESSDVLLPEYRLEIAQGFCEHQIKKEDTEQTLADCQQENARLRNSMRTLADFLKTGLIPANEKGSGCAEELYRQLIPLINKLHRQKRARLKRQGMFHVCKCETAEPIDKTSTSQYELATLTPPDDAVAPAWSVKQGSAETSSASDEERDVSSSVEFSTTNEDIAIAAPPQIPTLGVKEVDDVLSGDTSFQFEDLNQCWPSVYPNLANNQSACCYHLYGSRAAARCPLHGHCMPLASAVRESVISSSRYNAVDNSLTDFEGEAVLSNRRATQRRSDVSLTLWEFLLECLHYRCYENTICWLEKAEGTFKILQSQTLAGMWGMHKRLGEMNFDKMSRAMRYYYKKGILIKQDHGKRLIYNFGDAVNWRTWQPKEDSYPGRFYVPFHLQNPFAGVRFDESVFNAFQSSEEEIS